MSASTRPTFLPIRASATARLAATVDLPTPPLPEPMAMILRSGRAAVIATRALADLGDGQRGVANARLERGPLVGRQAAGVEDDRGDRSFSRAERMRAASGWADNAASGAILNHCRRHNRLFDQRHCFSPHSLPISPP